MSKKEPEYLERLRTYLASEKRWPPYPKKSIEVYQDDLYELICERDRLNARVHELLNALKDKKNV